MSIFQKVIDFIGGRSDIIWNNSTYMKRWRLVDNRFFGVRVHKIVRSDEDRELHDHPWTFLSFILSGGYIEHRPFGVSKEYRRFDFVFRRAEDLHRLQLHKEYAYADNRVVEKPAWTFVIRGPTRRRWGFMTQDGWIDAEDFDRHREAMRQRGYKPPAFTPPRETHAS